MSAPPAGAAGAPAFDRSAWQASLQVGDLLDVDYAADPSRNLPAGNSVCRVTEATETQLAVSRLYWHDDLSLSDRTGPFFQPLGSKTQGKYTGPPERLKAFLQSQLQPSLTAVPLHPHHQLQRFRFDFDWQCSKCAKQKSAGQSQSYSCLPCKYDLCVDCFIADGGVDTHPLPCIVPTLESFALENFSKLEFVEELKEYECGVCLEVACNPPNLLCGHLFCSGCLKGVDPALCPTCRQAFQRFSLQPSAAIHRLIANQKVQCSNRANGCAWTGDLGPNNQHLTEHLMKCAHRLFSCPRCAQSIQVRDVDRHVRQDCIVREIAKVETVVTYVPKETKSVETPVNERETSAAQSESSPSEKPASDQPDWEEVESNEKKLSQKDQQ